MKRIDIKGAIVSDNEKWLYDYFDMQSTSPNDINCHLENNTGDIEVIINSGGGDVYAGSEIYTALKSHDGNVNVKVVGICASSASVIAMAGDKIEMSPTSQIMIHNVSMSSGGDHQDLTKSADILRGYDKSIANAYEIKTGKSQEEILEMMNKETWFDAKSALKHGFADEIMFQNDTLKFVASVNTPTFSNETINKVRALKERTSATENIKLNEVEIEKIAEEVSKKINKQTNKQVNKETSKYTRFMH